MPKNNNFDKVIPGIALVPDLDLEVFFLTEEGREIKSRLNEYEKATHSSSSSYADNAALRQARMRGYINSARDHVAKSPGFSSIKKLIYHALLKNHIFDYVFSNSEEQATLVDKPYTAELYDSYAKSQSIESIERSIVVWKQAFDADADTDAVDIRGQISSRKSLFIHDTKEKIGFLFAFSGQSEDEKNALFYDVAKELYYSNTDKARKKQILTEKLNAYLKPYKKYQPSYRLADLPHCFSHLFHHVKQLSTVQDTKAQMDRIANVHLLYGILGLREPAGWVLENIDIYNYVNIAEDVNTAKTVLFAFAKPLHSFFMEYVEITKLEKKPLDFLFRATMPILIMTCFVAFAFSLMVPFAMHAIIEIIMLIPTLYISMVAASVYVDLKNQAFENWIIYWRGSRYEHEAFKKNDRMLHGFDGNKVITQAVCDYYVACLTDCDAIISSLQGSSSDEQIAYHQAMLKRAALLKMEWYDIHDNHSLGFNNIKTLVMKRLDDDALEAYQDIYNAGNGYIKRLIEELEQHLGRCTSTENGQEPDKKQGDYHYMKRKDFHPHMRWSMFKPTQSLTHLAEKCLSQQNRIKAVEKSKPIIESSPSILTVY